MQTISTEFDNICKANGLGPREDIENYPDVPAAPLYEYVRQVAHALIATARKAIPSLPPIYFDFVHSPNVNAVAFQMRKGYGIGITAGAIILVSMLFHRMLASKNLFPNIGDTSGELNSLPIIPWSILDASQLYSMGIRPIGPQDKERNVFAIHLTEQALMFIVGHEIAHICRGHVDYLHSKTGTSFLAELGWSGDGNDALIRQAIELDADARSIESLCWSAFDTYKHNPGGKKPEWSANEVGVLDWHFEWAFAVNAVFRLFGDKKFLKTDFSTDSYPPLALRRMRGSKVGENSMVTIIGEEGRLAVQQVLSLASTSIDQAFLRIGGKPAGGGMSEASETESQRHLQDVNRCWHDMLPDLRKYSYESL